ncbi:hypothetical protein MATL_G00041740 [Megalops atlanticus]|uniref:Ig-like domain-containing protein n=1 Tax=Megalops atlanticus TaxID=7932 RepID=A0A9D3QEE0_MEGAT|nr:hypothetical protein MATL_G00041740 [Megalops atlanticus]
MLLCIKHGTLWMILCCDVMSVIGQSQCRSSHLQTTNVTAALDSDALLPCDFNENLLQEARSGDVAVVWTHGTMINLVEIKLSGQPSYWDHRGGRVRTFPKMPGNFSLLISRVQESDLGRYRCELFDGSNCSIAYEVVELRQLKLISVETLWLVDNWYFVAAGGAIIVSLFITGACCVQYKCVKAPLSRSGNLAVGRKT